MSTQLDQHPPSSAAERRVALQTALTKMDVEALLLTNLVDIRWATGFTGSNAALLVPVDGPAVLATDGRYTEQAANEVPDLEIVIDRATIPALLNRGAHLKVGIDPMHTTLSAWAGYHVHHPALSQCESPVAALRRVKGADEITHLKRACEITDEAVQKTWDQVRPGMTERQVRRILEGAMLDLGGEVGFESIVATGANSAIPHHSPTDTVIQVGDLLKIDCGAKVNGYHADMTRVAIVGREPARWQQDLHSLVLTAQQAGVNALRAGLGAVELDECVRSIIRDAGHGDNYTHGLGHGVGLEIHEPPFVGAAGTDRIEQGVSVTVEPGVYLQGQGGVRIEDTLLVDERDATSLTQTDRALRVVGI